MKTFNKIICAVLAFLLLLGVFSAIIIEPMIQSESAYYLDAGIRKSLAGSIEFIFIGDSDGMTAFDPCLFDTLTGKESYNLSGTMMTTGSMQYLLDKETDRNPLDTVVLQISLEMLNRNYDNEKGDGDSVTVQRLENAADKISFLCRHVALEDWMNIYSRVLVSGMVYWKEKLLGADIDKVDYSLKGFHPAEANNLELTETQARKKYNSRSVEINLSDEYYKSFQDVVKTCIDKGIQVVIAVLPVANSHVWELDQWEVFEEWIRNFSTDLGVTYYDFNLFKDKYVLFSDSTSYKDYAHMSETGASAFTESFAKVYNASLAGKSTDDLFYGSYEEMKNDSPYMKYLSD